MKTHRVLQTHVCTYICIKQKVIVRVSTQYNRQRNCLPNIVSEVFRILRVDKRFGEL